MQSRCYNWLLAAVCTTWLGCAGGEPEASWAPGTGSPHSAGLTTDGGTVLVTSTSHFHTAGGITEVPNDLSSRNLALLVPNGSTFTQLTGAATDGGWQFTGVPPGLYYLKTGSTYTVTDAREVELDSHDLGRADAVYSPVSTSPVNIHVTNLAPWMPYRRSTEPGSSLQLASGQVNLGAMLFLDEEVPTGQTSLVTSAAEMWNMTGPTPICEAAKGDRLYVNQLSQLDAGTLPDGGALGYSTVVRSVETAPFDYTADGITPLSVTGALQPVPQTPFTLDWRLSEYAAHASEVHPTATPATPDFYVMPSAYGLSHGWVGNVEQVLHLSLPPGTSSDFSRSLSYGTPYPSSWGMVGYAQSSFRVWLDAPDGASYGVLGNLFTQARLEDLVAGPVRPRVSPPRSLTLDGMDASTSREVGSLTPVIAWQAPALGTPSAYRVTVFGPRFSSLVIKGYVYVPGSLTQVRLPPGLLSPGAIHYLRVTAIDAPFLDLSRMGATRHLLPNAHADALSAIFTTP
ncbi:hypothetical protein HPC49_00585 [Pyxidicoccus fallax]|uniref:Lipoprotein n=1 Tax=Pyxidicoccus fallax TaxID=394095 RepID=A0A848LB57_9BACT|nr:hypothetical protein [Pyxidicoccus fallax]NMO13541.1 hypothetical protein [Pyxidicoccus fallax]NPC76751.1 hypothetical protein [Pyxidicoccus fallax]